MTSKQLQPSPPFACPPWAEHPDRSSWEQKSETGQLVRDHQIGQLMVPAEGYPVVEASGCAEEYADGTPMHFSVLVSADGVFLTPEQTLALAEQLKSLALRVQYVRHTVEAERGAVPSTP